jgi:CMP-N-acetylneuraminic acid synthetase
MGRRAALLEIGGYDESFRCQDGWDIWIRLIQHYRVANVNLPLFYYRQHAKSLTRDESNLLKTRAEILGRQAERKGSMLNTVAIVPVRGSRYEPGSIPLQALGDRTVLDWTLDAALESDRIKTLAVTTPDADILEHVARRYGDRVVRVERTADLARRNTHIEDTVFHALSQLEADGARAEAVAVLYTECPFRTARQIDMAIDMLCLFETDTVVGVRPETDVFYAHNGKGLQELRSTAGLRLEREEIYRGAGKLYVARRDYLERTRKLMGGRVGHVVIEQRAAIQITSEWDFEIARYWARRLVAGAQIEDAA